MERRTNPTATNNPGVWIYGARGLEPVTGIPITDRGFRYGLHSFETLRVRHGRAEFVTEHLELLHLSPWAQTLPIAELKDWLSRPFECEGFVRIFVTAGDGPANAAIGESRIYLWFEAREIDATDSAMTVALSPYPAPHHPGQGKSGNYAINLAALADAKARGFDEALLFNAADELVGAGMANVFYSLGGKWFTPLEGRRGVIRGWVMQQTEVMERTLLRSEIGEIESAFLTSSGIGIVPIQAIEGRRLKDDPLVNQLRTEWVGSPILDHRAIPTQGRAVSLNPPSSL